MNTEPLDQDTNVENRELHDRIAWIVGWAVSENIYKIDDLYNAMHIKEVTYPRIVTDLILMSPTLLVLEAQIKAGEYLAKDRPVRT